MALGVYPEVSLAEARAKHREAHKLVAQGLDPSLEKQNTKRERVLNAENTFEVIAREWYERMNGTIKEATVKRYNYDSHEQLKIHLRDFINAYNFGKRLKTLKGLTPYEYICKIWTTLPERFTINPTHQSLGLYT